MLVYMHVYHIINVAGDALQSHPMLSTTLRRHRALLLHARSSTCQLAPSTAVLRFGVVASSTRYSRLRKLTPEWLDSDISHVRDVE